MKFRLYRFWQRLLWALRLTICNRYVMSLCVFECLLWLLLGLKGKTPISVPIALAIVIVFYCAAIVSILPTLKPNRHEREFFSILKSWLNLD